VFIACWAAKGGSGTTVVAAALALSLCRAHRAGALLDDLPGDAPPALGCTGGPEGTAGLADWLADPAEGPEGLRARELVANERLRVLPRGRFTSRPSARGDGAQRSPVAVTAEAADPRRVDALVAALADDRRPVVVDCGVLSPDEPGSPGAVVALSASHSVLVTRLCFLSLRRAVLAPARPTGIVVLVEPGRALRAADVEATLGAPVVAEIAYDAAVARCVDAGLLATRLPRSLARAVGSLVA
jgi:hypothetical protein